jgi:hypothetical protein
MSTYTIGKTFKGLTEQMKFPYKALWLIKSDIKGG